MPRLEIVSGDAKVARNLLEEPWDFVFFTDSGKVGQIVSEVLSSRLIPHVLELGGKNALVVCDDADLVNAAQWGILSAFSNAGQRCAAAEDFPDAHGFERRDVERTNDPADHHRQIGDVATL